MIVAMDVFEDVAIDAEWRALPEAELLNPAGYQPEFLRGVLRSGAARNLFCEESDAASGLETVRQAACRSVELALSLGITASLFTTPVRRFALELWERELEHGFLTEGLLGGMMITEPVCGTDMAACETMCRPHAGGFELTGTKQWAGLTGLADYWLVLAKDGEAGKGFRFPSLNFYVCRNDPESFQVIERFGTAGLRSIPYGITRIHAREGVITPLLSGSKTGRFRLVTGILQRSRISIAAITYGACQRIAAEARKHTQSRLVFGKSLAEYGQVQARMAEIEGARDVSAVLFGVARREAARADATGEDVSALHANIVKTVCTDLAFASATSASQLLGGNSYRTDTYIGRATADLRPFRIFEGSNDVLCDAIWQAVEKTGKTGGNTFAAVVEKACALAGIPVPSPSPLAAIGAEASVPQGLRCLGGRILANATCLRWCVEQGLSRVACRPLIARMTRDFDTAETWGADAGLLEY